ncbi:AraC family transcriptional regulator [Cohnella sp. REN36]|uniref:helix-turn-helix transcriptional regulator n=1 Tax=Cohnella sp. REN36 TaxID=2887347 RepID=UPI001D149CE6|nr:AraC family transcriptional regulator [Cohnella sp. REN36]MCC3372028.1 AraC family transcriptional regulator [Cohnella sp. REN36]
MTTIYYVGYDAAHPDDFVYDIPEGHDFWLLILTQTPAEIWVRGDIREYPANCAVLFPPRQKIYYRACSDRFVNDWVRFNTGELFLTETTLPLGIPIPMPDPDYGRKLFQLLAVENFLDGGYRELSIDYLLRILFNKMLEASQSTEKSPYYHRLLDLRKKIHQQPGHPWSVASMAEDVHLSPGYLQSLYKSAFGISCMEDVIQCRIRLAKERLVHGPQRIADIAALCGYPNVEHFSRQFRQIAGCTPRSFRKSVLKTAD